MKGIKHLVLILLFANLNIFSQTQTDVPWPTLSNSDWPMIKHDPQFSGRSPYKGPQTATIAWTRDMTDGIFSGPVIGEKGNLYFGSYYVFADKFYSYDPDGNFRWEYSTGSGRPPQSGILIDSSNTIYFGSRDSNFYALNLDGTFKWKYKTSAPIPQEVIANIDLQGNLYVTNLNGELYSIKPNGELNWSISYESGFSDRSPAISSDGNTIYIPGLDSNLYALNLDGSLKWKFSCGIIQKAPMIDSYGNSYFIPYYPQFLYSLNPEGNIRWRKAINSLDYSIPTIDKEGNIYVIAIDSLSFPDKALFSFDFNGTFRWSYVFNEFENDDFWQPLICDSEGTVYAGSTMGYYYYAISSDGVLKWKLPLIEQQQQVDNTGAIAKDGTLYLGVHDVSLLTNQQKTLIAIRDTGIVSVPYNNVSLTGCKLYQNYPNPFNPSTKIRFQISSTSDAQIVTLKVYDILGREVELLVNERKKPGEYEVEFDGDNLPSGIYIYSLSVNGYVQNEKMILLK